LSRQFERLELDEDIEIEALALFIRYFLTVGTPVPEAHQEAARAQGKARFEQFVGQLGRHLLRGRSLVRDAVEKLQPDTTSVDRRIRMLRTATGPLMAAALEDPDVVEVMLKATLNKLGKLSHYQTCPPA